MKVCEERLVPIRTPPIEPDHRNIERFACGVKINGNATYAHTDNGKQLYIDYVTV